MTPNTGFLASRLILSPSLFSVVFFNGHNYLVINLYFGLFYMFLGKVNYQDSICGI